MNTKIIFCLCIFLSLTSFAQNKISDSSVTLLLRLEKSTDDYLLLYYTTIDDKEAADTITLQKDGSYSITTRQIKKPQLGLIYGQGTRINNVFIAPGYHLLITGDTRDFHTLLKTQRFSGYGSANFSYYYLLDSIIATRQVTGAYYTLPEKKAMSELNSFRKLKDSLADIVFYSPLSADPYSPYFGSVVKTDNQFYYLSMVFEYAQKNNYTRKATDLLIKKYFQPDLKAIIKDSLLKSEEYRRFINADYVKWLADKSDTNNYAVRSSLDYRLDKITKFFTGQVKQYALYETARLHLSYNVSNLEELNSFQQTFKKYEQALTDHNKQELVSALLEAKRLELEQSLTGQPCPVFKGITEEGKAVNITSFLGKVLYVDLWASWCVPCREETPFLDKLAKRYAQEPDIAFLSIAVSDQLLAWKDAIKKDKPTWPQWFDKGQKTNDLFIGALAIPRFIIVGKKGEIADYNAPRPSEPALLIPILEREIAK